MKNTTGSPRKDDHDDDGEAYELTVETQVTRLKALPKGVKRKKGSDTPWYYLGLIGEIGFAIAVPIAGGALLGVFVDRVWLTTHKATISLLFIGIIVSFINLFTTVREITNHTS